MDIMIDIESMGLAPRGAINSIGALSFNTEKIDRVWKANITLQSNEDFLRVIDASTVDWWLRNSQEAQRALYQPKPLHLYPVLLDLVRFYDEINPENVWANGTTFDFVMLRSAFKDVGVECPWHYGQEMCLRPMRDLGKKVGVLFNEYKKAVVTHDAAEDCKAQAQFLIDLWKKLNIAQ